MPEYSEATKSVPGAARRDSASAIADVLGALMDDRDRLRRALYDVLADYDRAGWVHAETLRRARETLRKASS